MIPLPLPLVGLLALVLVLALWGVSVKLRAAAGRGRGVRVYDLGADLRLPAPMQDRSYQIALYLTMKSRAAEEASLSARAAPR